MGLNTNIEYELKASKSGELLEEYTNTYLRFLGITNKLKEFEKLAMLKKAIVVSDFGRVIHSGYGENPPEHITKTLENMKLI